MNKERILIRRKYLWIVVEVYLIDCDMDYLLDEVDLQLGMY